MKTGTYTVSFNVDLTECEDEESAHAAVAAMVEEMLEGGEFPEVEFELVEEFEVDYKTEEDEVEELEF